MTEELFDPEEVRPKLKPWQHPAGPYDLAEGERLRDEGMARVIAHTEAEYEKLFKQVFHDFVMQRRDFTAEDVTARAGMPPGHVHPNAIGALFRSLAVRYRLTKVGRVKAQRTGRHANEIAVWGKR